ncbi:GNAT family N-acetyltransferase [Vibrio splendidus]|jgi:N-acetylglutamate synthase-like GNAT family acetyltransferase|uniref:N-acetyltransferase n=1 Tax=Vibrio splendidus TaxID=29497 RepID=A0A2T5ESL1_VIBSP|nr:MULTISPECIES: GNAT family N-acetyltransferase [Vibrio]MBE8566261.1 GNAT family N-acetyltransferase [Vibrio sp. OPT20]OEF66409.1 GNAT family N-acetyltransferase [Vibrio splendidus 1F-157]PMI27810.1 GNAT family N-acetyltransferase [Vibrio splendidus]PMJ62566.1 GNAT family N-acetyltransferase [Vibrio splendidus]PMO72666.1 GNAT family N-acetyltransferase [Vibrio splendidus]
MQKVIFRNCDESSPYWSELERLFQSEWSDFKFKDTYKDCVQLPPVIIVLRDNVVIGGLAYSHFQEPHQVRDVVWINAVYVDAQWRGQGIASELINRGVKQFSSTVQTQLYVYTNVMELYQGLGWSVVDIDSEANHKVMSIELIR